MFATSAFSGRVAGALLCLGVSAVAAAEDIASLDQLLEVRVQTATLAKQTLRDAPADVTVITAAEIRRFGYRTLGEVLSNVRGFYTTHDGGFLFAGVRGFSLLGDYNTRFLVMLDGHPLTDSVYGAMYMFGQDFGLDIDLVDQIEVVRGPSSALYGSNGMFATINILTKKAPPGRSGEVSMETGSFGEQKLLATGAFTFGASGSALFSASGFHTVGREAVLDGTHGLDHALTLRGLGKERGFHTFSKIGWKDWTFVAMFGDRRSAVPVGFYGADIGDTGTATSDNRNVAMLSWNRSIGDNRAIRWRGFYDQYRYDAVYNYMQSDGARNYDGAASDSVGNQLVYEHRTARFGALTVGTEASVDLRNVQSGYWMDPNDQSASQFDTYRLSHPNASYAVFAQHELNLGPRFTLYLGGRVDDSRNNHHFASPRVALIYKQRTASYKLMYGGAFRNPSTYERYWTPNPDLRGEGMKTLEFSREHTIHRRLTLITSLYHYRLRDMIGGAPVSEFALQYRNLANARAAGFEAEVNGRPTDWLHTGASFAVQRTEGTRAEGQIENSPQRIAQFRVAAPVLGERFVPAVAFRYLSERYSAYKTRVPQVALMDVTMNSRWTAQNLRLQFGVRNIFDARYLDPLSTEHTTNLLPRAGRSFFVKLTWEPE